MSKLSKETKAYKNKLNYISQYNKEKCKTFTLKLIKDKDTELIEFIENQQSVPRAVRDLFEVYKKGL